MDPLQPFLLEGDDRGTSGRHIPDYLLGHADGSVCAVDVKPAQKLSGPKVRDSLGWSRRVIEKHGWEYRVLSEPDPVALANLQFLAGYRRSVRFDPAEASAAAAEVGPPQIFGDAVRAVTPITGDAGFARSLVLHLAWSGGCARICPSCSAATALWSRHERNMEPTSRNDLIYDGEACTVVEIADGAVVVRDRNGRHRRLRMIDVLRPAAEGGKALIPGRTRQGEQTPLS